MSSKHAPIFDPDQDDNYSAWKADVEIWQVFTDVPTVKQGPAVYLALKGRARDAVRWLTAKDLAVDGGVNLITDKLDEVFLSDETTRAYCAFKDFVMYRRESGDNFSKFIVEFERRYRDICRFKLELPEGVRAFFLLSAANLTHDAEKLARTTAELNFKDMKDKLMKIFGSPDSHSDGGGGVPLVKEEAFVADGTDEVLSRR